MNTKENSKIPQLRESPRGRSMLNLYKQCPRRWAFKYIKGFLPEIKSDPLILGSAIHESQALFYQQKNIVLATDYLNELLKDSPHLQNKANKMLTAWYQELGKDDLEKRVTLAVEVEAPIILPNNFQMTVRWDRILLDTEDGEIFINDTKTTSASVTRVLQTYNYSDQPKLYIASVKQSRAEWLKQFRGWRTDAIYGRELKSGKINTEIVRSAIVSFTDQEIEDTLKSYAVLTDDIKFKLDEVFSGSLISNNFYTNSDSCYSFGRVCPYKSICHEIDRIEEPPANMSIDPWLEQGIIKDAFDQIKE